MREICTSGLTRGEASTLPYSTVFVVKQVLAVPYTQSQLALRPFTTVSITPLAPNRLWITTFSGIAGYGRRGAFMLKEWKWSPMIQVLRRLRWKPVLACLLVLLTVPLINLWITRSAKSRIFNRLDQ